MGQTLVATVYSDWFHRNITIATFAENAFFKAEAYGASLRAGKILADHGVAVAYKSVRFDLS